MGHLLWVLEAVTGRVLPPSSGVLLANGTWAGAAWAGKREQVGRREPSGRNCPGGARLQVHRQMAPRVELTLRGKLVGRGSRAGEGSSYRLSLQGIRGNTVEVPEGEGLHRSPVSSSAAHPHSPQGKTPAGTQPRCIRRSGVEALGERPGSGQSGHWGTGAGLTGSVDQGLSTKWCAPPEPGMLQS